MNHRCMPVAVACLFGLATTGLAQRPARAPQGTPQAAGVIQQQQRDAAIEYDTLLNYYHEAFGLASDPAPIAASEEGMLGMPFALEMLAKAQPDECFFDIGAGQPPTPPCQPDAIEKTNQAYVWGLTQQRDKLWWGTAPNVHCLVMGGYLGMTSPVQTPDYVCEFGQSWIAQDLGLPDAIGDFRPPQIFLYDLALSEPSTPVIELTDRVTGLAGMALRSTLGIRSAGALRNVVFFAGPAMVPNGTINMFAFDARDGEFLGYENMPLYDNIRKFRAVEGHLYFGVGNSSQNPDTGGSVLRWTGDLSDPFQFEVVGLIDSDVAELVGHNNRVAITTWPGGGGMASVQISPDIPVGGLTSAHKDSWIELWDAGDYEPNQLVAMTYGGGAIASYGDWLYWGTMHVPGVSMMAHMAIFGPPSDPLDMVLTMLGTWRAISIHRMRVEPDSDCFAGPELLYGEWILPVYDPQEGWTLELNNEGPPLRGHSGFGNLFNNYTWTMEVFQERLAVGTMDCAYLFLGGLGDDAGMPPEFGFLGTRSFGADLWMFPTPEERAILLYGDGMENEMSYGIRTMFAGPATLFLGMANPMNLHPDGGWELLALRDTFSPCVADLTGDGRVTRADLFFILLRLGNTGAPGTVPGDVSGDGDVDVQDFRQVMEMLGATCSGP